MENVMLYIRNLSAARLVWLAMCVLSALAFTLSDYAWLTTFGMEPTALITMMVASVLVNIFVLSMIFFTGMDLYDKARGKLAPDIIEYDTIGDAIHTTAEDIRDSEQSRKK